MKLIAIPVGDFQANCYLLIAEDKKTAIIDPGAEPEKIMDAITAHDCSPEMILLTHGHFDHIMAVNKIALHYNIPVYAHSAEEGTLLDGQKSLARHFLGEDFSVSCDKLLEDGDKVPFGSSFFTVLYTPGHSAGSVCYRFADLLFSGDTLFRDSIGRTDLGDGDMEVMRSSLVKLNTLQEDLQVFPGHGPSTTLQREKQFNPFLRSLA